MPNYTEPSIVVFRPLFECSNSN